MNHGILPPPARPKQARNCAALLLACALAACAVKPRAPGEEADAQLLAVAALAAEGRHLEAATRYETLAVTGFAARRDDMLARAALEWLAAGDRERAVLTLRRIEPARLGADGVALVAIARAALLLADGELAAARETLAIDVGGLGPETRARLHLARAELLFTANEPLAAAEQLVIRDRHIADQARRRIDQERVWDTLVRLRGAVDDATLAPGTDPDFVRWVGLAEIVRGAWQDPDGASARLAAWRAANPDHPASQWLLDELVESLAKRDTYPAKVALLLPLTGRFAAQAAAVRDGALAARYGLGAAGPELLILDTGDQPGGAAAALAGAAAAGANFVIGPLTKEAVAELARAGRPALPLLALNYLDGEAASPDGFWQFGLLPEGEAAQAAEHAAARGFARGIVLYPKGDWGHRMLRSFETRFNALEGAVLTAQMFDPEESDYSTAIMRALNLDESRGRAQQLAAALGTRLEAEPRRRQDVEFVFIAARDREAPLLRTQLRFHRATRLPVLATSHVYRTDAKPDPDLDGVSFADMPWIIGADEASSGMRTRLATLWPREFARSGRLYALGFDALRLVPMLANFPAPLAEPVPGATGVLSMDFGNRIRRDLFWAEFAGGVPRPETSGAPAIEAAESEPEPGPSP